jgi:hypothetical protein
LQHIANGLITPVGKSQHLAAFGLQTTADQVFSGKDTIEKFAFNDERKLAKVLKSDDEHRRSILLSVSVATS